MDLLRKLLFPFAAVFHLVTSVRNFCYDRGWFRSHSFEIPVVAVGNLSTGGTGKSPMVEALIRMLQPEFHLAVLSRGYGRKTKGFVLADAASAAETIGDEPFQIHRKFPEIPLAVDADRVAGIRRLRTLDPKLQLILLDDAFQHRRVQAKLYLLLTSFGDLYCDDFLLPTGNLRESRRGAKRAKIIVVTKCPPDLSAEKRNAITMRLKTKPYQKVFFSSIGYGDVAIGEKRNVPAAEMAQSPKLIVAGIAKPKPFVERFKAPDDTVSLFPDHHDFTDKDVRQILEAAKGRTILTTEKDYVRLAPKLPGADLVYVPIQAEFWQKESFEKAVRKEL